MATPAQIAANQANARLSTGPRTPEGKAAVSGNAERHGFTSKNLRLSGEDRGVFEEFREKFREELQPSGMLEEELFEQIVHAAWNLRRIRIAERAFLDAPDWEFQKIEKLTRYRRASERDFHRALAELKARQADRALRAETESPSLSAHQMASAAPPLAFVQKLAKQTQFLLNRFEDTEMEAVAEELEKVLAAGR
jgi:hypothetical protein